jgi:hypothetical protein
MRRLLATLAMVLTAAVIEVEAQHHGTPEPHAAKAGEKPADKPADVVTVLARINKKLGTEVSDVRRESPAPR